MSEIKWGQVMTAAVIFALIGGLFGAFVFPREVLVDGVVANETDCPTVNQTDCPTDQTDCSECKTDEELKKEAIITGGYLIDGLFLEETFEEILSDREIYLFDDEIEFDGDDYDAEEIFRITGIILKANDNTYDFDGNAYLTIPENSIAYEFVIEEGFNTSLIGNEDEGNEDETLQISLLGQDITISEWTETEVTLTQGKEYVVEEDETITVNDKDVTVLWVISDRVYLSVGDETKTIQEGSTRTIGGLEIKVKETVDFGARIDKTNRAVLVIGEQVEKTISDGDEYSDDSIWEWVITSNSIGIVLTEDFEELDEDFNALAPEEILCLPNDYVCVRYNGLIGQDTEEYNFDIDHDLVRVKGNFLDGTKEYNTVYIDTTGIYDDDDKENLIDETKIELGDTNSILNISTGLIIIEDFEVNFDLNVTNVGDDDVDYRTIYGILIENPEDSIDNHEFTITVPEEKLEGIITVKKGGFEETKKPVCDVDNLDLCLDETTCTDTKGYWYADECNLEAETTA